MAKVLISGYYGFDNAGDDSVLYGIISSLKKKDPTLQFSVLSNSPSNTEQTFGIPAYNRWNFAEVVQQIKNHDLLLMGGGSLLQDATSPRSVIYYLGIVIVAKLFKKRVVFYAQGIGPITKNINKQLISHIVNKVDVITVRDFNSGEDLKQFGVTKTPIVVTADPAVMIPASSIDVTFGKTLLNELGLDPKKTIVFSVRSWKKEERFKIELAKVADYYSEKGMDVLFLPMQYPADIVPSEDIVRRMKNKGKVIDRPLNFKEIISLIGNVKIVLGMRLHSIILAAVMNVPFVGITYDPKIDRFVERVQMQSAGHIKDIHAADVISIIEQTITKEEQVKQMLALSMKEIVIQAEKSSELTIELLR